MEYSKSEIQLLNAAKSLFWRYGLKRITVEEIADSANLSKMTFYRYFENKLDIAKKVLDKIVDESLKEYKAILDSNIPFVEKLEATILLKSKNSEKIGIEFLQDLLLYGGEEFQSYLQNKRLETTDLVMNSFKQAQKEGAVRKDLNLEIIPILSEHMTSLASNVQFVDMFGSPQAAIKEITTFFFYGIVSHQNHP